MGSWTFVGDEEFFIQGDNPWTDDPFWTVTGMTQVYGDRAVVAITGNGSLWLQLVNTKGSVERTGSPVRCPLGTAVGEPVGCEAIGTFKDETWYGLYLWGTEEGSVVVLTVRDDQVVIAYVIVVNRRLTSEEIDQIDNETIEIPWGASTNDLFVVGYGEWQERPEPDPPEWTGLKPVYYGYTTSNAGHLRPGTEGDPENFPGMWLHQPVDTWGVTDNYRYGDGWAFHYFTIDERSEEWDELIVRRTCWRHSSEAENDFSLFEERGHDEHYGPKDILAQFTLHQCGYLDWNETGIAYESRNGGIDFSPITYEFTDIERFGTLYRCFTVDMLDEVVLGSVLWDLPILCIYISTTDNINPWYTGLGFSVILSNEFDPMKAIDEPLWNSIDFGYYDLRPPVRYGGTFILTENWMSDGQKQGRYMHVVSPRSFGPTAPEHDPMYLYGGPTRFVWAWMSLTGADPVTAPGGHDWGSSHQHLSEGNHEQIGSYLYARPYEHEDGDYSSLARLRCMAMLVSGDKAWWTPPKPTNMPVGYPDITPEVQSHQYLCDFPVPAFFSGPDSDRRFVLLQTDVYDRAGVGLRWNLSALDDQIYTFAHSDYGSLKKKRWYVGDDNYSHPILAINDSGYVLRYGRADDGGGMPG